MAVSTDQPLNITPAITTPLDSSTPTPTAPQPITLDANTTSYLLDPQYVQSRAFKASYGLQGTAAEQPPDVLSNAISQGQEQFVRDDAASTLNQGISEQKQNAAITLAQKPGPLTDDDLKWLNGTPAFNTYFNPKSVFETNYANAVTNELDNFSAQGGNQNAWNILKQFPGTGASAFDAVSQFGTRGMAYHEYILNRLQGTQSKINNQSSGGAIADFAKMAFPFLNPYYELKMRSNVPGVGFFDGLLGHNLEDQRQKILSMPFDQGSKVFDTIMDKLDRDNPQAAAAFGASMLGQTSVEYGMNQINTVGNLTDIPTVLKAGMVVYKGGSVINQARRAIATTSMANAVNPDITKANILASVGNIREAAIAESAEKVNNIIKGSVNPTADALDALPRFMRADVANIERDPGALTTTQVNAITDQYKASESKILDRLVNILRPTRIPLEQATPEVMSSLADAAIGRYPGMKNAIIRFSDPTLEPISNTYHVSAWLGKGAGEFFNSEDEALQYARYHGLAVKYSPDQIDNIKLRMDDIRQQIKDGPEMDADTAGLNHYYGLDKQLKDLQAQYTEATRNKTGASIGQQGNGYYIEITKPLNETDKIIRDFVYNPERLTAKTPDSWTKYIPFFNYARTPEDTLSAEHNAMRKASIYPQAKLLRLARDEWTNNIKPLRKEEADGMKKALVYGQDAIDPNTGLKGWYFDTPKQLQDWYLTNLDRAPTFNEQQAYFSVKRWSEYDLMLREMALYRNKSRLGAETHQVISKDAAGNEVRSNKFDGVVRNRFPTGDHNVLVMGDTVESSKLRSTGKNGMKVAEKNELSKGIKDGTYKIIEPYDAKQLPFKDFVTEGDRHIDYVITKNVETSPLTWEQLPQRGGGHFVYDYDHYVKQAKIVKEKAEGGTRFRYGGDITITGIPYRAMGQDLADKMNAVRVAFRDNKMDLAQALTTKHLPYEWSDLAQKFKTGVFNLDEPFQVVPKNRSIMDMSKDLERRYAVGGKFTDDTKRGLANNFQVQFTGQRDAEEFNSVVNTGTQTNPVYAFRPGEKVDPVQVMNRALGSIIHSTFMDDYKTYAVESWLAEASKYFKESFASDSQVRSSPFAVYRTATDDSFKPGTPPEVVQNLLANKFKIEQLVGTPSVWDTFLHSIASDLADNISARGGSKLAEKLTPSWLLSATRDPFSFIRGVTFDAYLGFGYIPQIFVQMASFVNMFGITPRYATTGTFGAYLHMLSRVNSNPEVLSHLDSLASKMILPGMPKWRPGEWKEAMEMLDRTGFNNVGAEYGPLANLKYAKPISSGTERFLNWGRKPFQMGESATRVGAWYIAFKEFRDKNPTGAIGREDLKTILARADLLYGNMSHASNSVLHTGILSLPTQFYSYQLRQAELFWGKRLGDTPAERMAARARLLAVNSAMFGVPMGFGITGTPASDYLRQEMLANGFFGQTQPYNVDQAQQTGKGKDWIEHMFMEGIPSTLLTLATGNNYNIGPRYGSQGFNQIRDAMNGDGSFWKVVSGASGSLGMNTWQNKDGFVQAMSAIIRGDTNTFPITADDFVDILKEVQTVNKLWGLKAALQVGKLTTKNSSYVMDTTKLNAIGMAIFGLQPQEQVDMHSMEQNLKDQKAEEQYYGKRFSQEWNRGLIASANNDPEQAKKYYARAIGWMKMGNLSPEKVSRDIASAIKGRESLVDRVAWEVFVQNAPPDKQQQYQQTYSAIHKYLQNKGN